MRSFKVTSNELEIVIIKLQLISNDRLLLHVTLTYLSNENIYGFSDDFHESIQRFV